MRVTEGVNAGQHDPFRSGAERGAAGVRLLEVRGCGCPGGTLAGVLHSSDTVFCRKVFPASLLSISSYLRLVSYSKASLLNLALQQEYVLERHYLISWNFAFT